MLLGSRCAACAEPGPVLCRSCIAALEPAPTLDAPAGIERCVALFAYDSAARDLVVNLKYRNARTALRPLGRALAALALEAGVAGEALGSDDRRPPPDLVVTWAPTSAARRRQRGFDQAALLAKAVARALGCPCRPLLARAPGAAQTGRSAVDRRAGPTFHARARPAGPVLLVDDVRTTGATLAAAAEALLKAGAPTVGAATLAATPAPRTSPRLKQIGPSGGLSALKVPSETSDIRS